MVNIEILNYFVESKQPILNGAKCDLNKVKLETMLATSISCDQGMAQMPLQGICQFTATQQRSNNLLV